MKEGFYFHRNHLYYGTYNEKQVSGRVNISKVTPEHIQTNHPISDDDWAVRLWDNHSLLEPEYADLQTMLLKMGMFMNLSPDQEVDFSIVERRLDISLPKELKRIYLAIQNQEEYFTGTEHFLPLDEIYVEQRIIVFFKKKRTPIAGYDLERGCLAEYYKKEWHIEWGGICCYQFCVGRMLTLAIENTPVFKKGRCKGKFVTTLNIERELENFCNEDYHLLSEFHVYGIAVLYSNDGLIAWIRSNGFYADIHAGAADEAQLEALAEHLGAMEWK
ncbi:hypothetical protein [Enterocloster lavalensis]|uniref:hypothetical protein n=1 Tax=Enterocloster lavalensis TaxID=460384 RepID=UPI0023EF795D|nr:hypothetical protein [Enterocloster lavalensis]